MPKQTRKQLLSNMIRSLIENDVDTATANFNQYLTRSVHNIVEMNDMTSDDEFELTFDVPAEGGEDDIDMEGDEFCTGCGEKECCCDDEAPFCGGCGCRKEECCCDEECDLDDEYIEDECSMK